MVYIQVANSDSVVAGIGKFKAMGGLEISDQSFGCLPVDSGGALAVLCQYGGHECDVMLCGCGSVHE